MPRKTPQADPLLITCREAAQLLSITPWSVYRLCNDGLLDGRYQGSRRYVTRASLDAYVRSLPTTPPAESA